MSNYQIAQPLDIDHMPAEVATEMLARGRLTARQRKQCMQARVRVFGSGTGAPLRSAALTDRAIERSIFPGEYPIRSWRRDLFFMERKAGVPIRNGFVFDADFSPPLPEEKLTRRFSSVPIDRLARQVARSIRARRRVQTAYAKLAGDESKTAVKLRRMLDLAAAHHEAIQDSAQETINARMTKCQS